MYMESQNLEEIEFNPFEKYQEWLIRMVRDSNLIAQFEGLNTLFVYCQCAQDVKSATMSTLPDLLDKINLSKNNFKDMTIKIIEMMFEKDMGAHITPELLKRFKTARNTKITEVSIQILTLILTKNKFMEIINIRNVLNGVAMTLVNQHKAIRDAGIQLLKEVYIRIDDDANSILSKFKVKIRPVLKNEILTALNEVEKQEGCEKFRIYPKVQAKEDKDIDEINAQANEKQLHDDIKCVDISQEPSFKNEAYDNSKIDLINLVSEGFDKLPYVTQIQEKKNKLVDLYNKLYNAFISSRSISDGDNYKIYNVLVLMLEDTNTLVFVEAIRIVELLAKMRDKGIIGKYAKKYTQVLFDKFKETKTAVLVSIKNCIDAFIENDIIPVDSLIDIALNADGSSGIKNKKVIVSSSKSKTQNPRVKQICLELFKNRLSDCNNTIASGVELEVCQIKFLNGMFNCKFEKPIQDILKMETSNAVREEAFSLLKELKKSCCLIGAEGNIISESKHINIDSLITTLPKKFQIKQLITELNLEEKEVGNRIRYISKSKDLMEFPIIPKSDKTEKPVPIKSESKNKSSTKEIEQPVELKSKNSNLYSIDANAFKDIKNGSAAKKKVEFIIQLIQTIEENEGIDLDKIEQKLIELQNENMLSYGKKYIFECIKYTLMHNLTENILDDNNMLLFDGFNMLIKKILSLSKEMPEGPQMIEDLIIILIVLSVYLYESKCAELANCLFNCCSINHNSEAFLIVLEMTMSQIYSNELELTHKFTSWQISKIFNSIFKWLIKKVPMFSIAGIKLTTVENLYKSMLSNIQSNPQNSLNDNLFELLQAFMEEVNNKREDFEYNEEDIHQEESSQINIKPASKLDKSSTSKTLKNNFINVEENETFHQQEDDQVDQEPEEEQIDEADEHPLKSKFIETFEEINKTNLKFKIMQLLNFVRLILSDTSVKDPDQGFFLTSDEFSRIVNILAYVMKINDVDPIEIFDTFELLKPVKIFDENELSECIKIKTKIVLENFVESIIDVTEIGHHDILSNYYKILNSFTMDLKKQEISKIIREIDYVDQKLDDISFRVHFRWLTKEILGQFFFLNDIEPLIPLLVTSLTFENDGKESPDGVSFATEVANLFKLAFELFGEEKSKKFIEVILIKNQKLYSIFFNWYYTHGFMPQDNRPKTTNADFYTSSPNKKHDKEEDSLEESKSNDDNDDGFPLGDNYKVVESRPKTSLGVLIPKERKDVNFDLSPSQTDSNEKHCLLTKSNLGSNLDDENNSRQPLMQFLTEEKQFETLASNLGKKGSMFKSKDFDFETAREHDTASPRISELRPENIQSRYEAPKRLENKDDDYKLEQDVLKQKIAEERDFLNKEWESKLSYEKTEHNKAIQALEKANEYYANKASDTDRLLDDLKEMKKLNEQLMDKYERTLQDNIERIKREEEYKQKAEQDAQNKKNSEFMGSAFIAFAKQNISNPMDLSMSLVIKEDSGSQQIVENPMIVKEHFNRLDKIFEVQRAILADNDDKEVDDSIINKDSVFKLQEYLIETENPEVISKPLLLCYLKNKTSRQKNAMLKSMRSALENEDVLLSLTDLHFQCLIDVFLKLYSLEKVCLMKYDNGDDIEDEELFDPSITKENIICVHKSMSSLLNSRDYTVIIKMLLKILRNELPEDFQKELSEERKLYLRALTRCLRETISALNDESSEAVRAFDILVEMNLLFKTHPPDMLKEGLPSLADFDYIYKCLRLTTDKIMEMQPEKVNDFLRYISSDRLNNQNNSFIRYLVQEMSAKHIYN